MNEIKEFELGAVVRVADINSRYYNCEGMITEQYVDQVTHLEMVGVSGIGHKGSVVRVKAANVKLIED